mgnify:CR=1 FL=1
MKIGSLASPVQVTNTWTVAYDSGELSAATTSLTISNINGDVDEEYQLIIRHIGGTGTGNEGIRFNGDTGTNYGWQRLYGVSTTAGASRNTADNIIRFADGTLNNISLGEAIIYAKSGYVRTTINSVAGRISGTTVDNVEKLGGSWNNTADNITSITIPTFTTDGLGIGSRFILLKKVTSTSGMKTGALEVQGSVYGTWQKVYSTTLDVAATSVTISGLDGNTDVMYRVVVRKTFGSDSRGDVRLNNDSGSNYGYQEITGAGSSIAASRSTTFSGILNAAGGATSFSGYIGMSETIIYAKSGYVRTALCSTSRDISGTTVNNIMLVGCSWSNTTDNITNLVCNASVADGLGIGTYIYLEKLVLS